MADNKELALKDYLAGIKIADIAKRYDVSENTVKSWRTRFKWGQAKKEQEKAQKSAPLLKKGAKKDAPPVGRPTIFSDEVINKLEYAYSNDFNDSEAAYYAEISPGTLSKKYKNDPEFFERMQRFKNKTRQAAKMVISAAITSGEVKTAQWYAEHKMSDEYSDKTEQVVQADVNAVVANPFEHMSKKEIRAVLRGADNE